MSKEDLKQEFICQVCGRQFKSLNGLNRHLTKCPNNIVKDTELNETPSELVEESTNNDCIVLIHNSDVSIDKRRLKYREFVIDFLSKCNIPFQQDLVMLISSQGDRNTNTYFPIEFLVDNKVNLEIVDSEAPIVDEDKRDAVISTHYKVYRINHNNSIEALERELYKFLGFMKG
jgi:hypothetical protein